MNTIILNATKLGSHSITYHYSINGEWVRFFTHRRQYTITYDQDIANVPLSICNIHFVANILPLAWLCDATVKVRELDAAFLQSIPNIKKGYSNMYPQANFSGNLIVDNPEVNTYHNTEKVAAFFSGGLDAMSTVASHYGEHPLLINIQGSDINLHYKKIVAAVKKYLTGMAKDLNLPITFINSGFRKVINEKRATKYIKPLLHDNYWHALQHGIAIISHAAPIAYLKKLKTVYIASSFSKRNHAPCASDPTIDNQVKLANTNISHDGYEYDRIDKSRVITEFIKKYDKPLQLRVCLDDYRVENCQHCEKCYRTIFDFAANGCDPELVGFSLSSHDYNNAKRAIQNKIFIQYPLLWQDIQKAFQEHPDLKKDMRYAWIYDYNFDTVNHRKRKYLYKVFYAIRKRFRKVLRLITHK